ncbi:hypothetical protein [Chromobacterium violaceum]|uniref:hypothetical protein n=1 Tax=Chromobacterium violaceum TaxID=536 RepID=UPI0012D2A61A|nr:hypothetical protein [Chromobacterium violaceum]
MAYKRSFTTEVRRADADSASNTASRRNAASGAWLAAPNTAPENSNRQAAWQRARLRAETGITDAPEFKIGASASDFHSH